MVARDENEPAWRDEEPREGVADGQTIGNINGTTATSECHHTRHSRRLPYRCPHSSLAAAYRIIVSIRFPVNDRVCSASQLAPETSDAVTQVPSSALPPLAQGTDVELP